ncbi:DUF4232 domain-containing protein [Streptomyces sp. NPDC017529]|uniref:DUF4232 domain-containing protein n=1 Tax=Streptomyces sp. NPDC017529 TaxID=3365000 RepID=UPI00378FA27C
MRSRLFTTRTARIAASAAAVAAALSLTACGGAEDGKKAAGADRPAASPGPDSAAGSAPVEGADGSAGTGGAGGTGGTGPSVKSPSGAGSHAAPAKSGPGGKQNSAPNGKSSTTCTAANTKVTVSKLSRPINHLLLTVTNTGSTRCDAYYYPSLRFDDAQAPTAVMEDSRPQAVVSVEPGQSAYAAVRTSDPTGEAGGGKTVHRLQVFFANRDGGYGDRSTRLTLPKDTYIDDSAKVTYWQSELNDAL